jgi:UTP:GlnB (protein PII) uridylyltransferase
MANAQGNGTVNTKIELKEISKAFSCTAAVRMSLHVVVYRIHDRGDWKLKILGSFNNSLY